ncbi:MAG: haloacid dehalogenase-like hydrolase [Clostridia bacterium]
MREIPIAALIYDFDHTLSPRDMQEYSFLPGLNVEPDEFWASCRRCAVENQMDGVLSYMFRMQQVASGRLALTRDTLRALGENIAFFPGVESWFDRINAIGRAAGVEVEHYIISSGLKEIIAGSRIAPYFTEVFAASYVYDGDGHAVWPATAVNYTSKTQYLFRINKGILDVTNDHDLNRFTPEQDRHVPFTNMIYLGDGLTDVPCMKLTRLKGGYSIAVHTPEESRSADNMLMQKRADFALVADYREKSELEDTVGRIFRAIRARHDLGAMHERQIARAESRKESSDPPVKGSAE